MLNVFTVAFFGHRILFDRLNLEKQLETHIQKIVEENAYVEFLVGRNGEFDILASTVVRKIRKNRDENNALILVLPYMTAEYNNNRKYFESYYNEIEICNETAHIHPKAAIQTRNKKMVDRADLVISYVENNFGGAYETLKYAKSKNKNIINLAFCED